MCLGGARVDEDVVRVAVAEADDVAGHGVDGGRARVRQTPLEPSRGLAVVLQEEVVQHRRKPRAHLARPEELPSNSPDQSWCKAFRKWRSNGADRLLTWRQCANDTGSNALGGVDGGDIYTKSATHRGHTWSREEVMHTGIQRTQRGRLTITVVGRSWPQERCAWPAAVGDMG